MAKLSYKKVKDFIENNNYKLISNEYIDAHTKLEMICDNGHKCEINFNNFKNNKRCNICYKEKRKINRINNTTKCLEEYDYELIEIINTRKIKVKCPNNHIYETRIDHFKNGRRCPYCNDNTFSYSYVKNYIEQQGYKLISKEYKNVFEKLEMICPNNHIYKCNFHNFKNNTRCNKCNRSLGEEEIEKYLKLYRFKYCYQYKIHECKNIFQLPFDYAVFNNKDELKFLIEYDGIQHYKPNEYFGGMDAFNKLKNNDEIKNNYCKKNNINLIRIPYIDFNKIKEIIKNLKLEESSTTK